MRRIGIDIGGTFTDCVIVWDGQNIERKALTTEHNFVEGVMNALESGAAETGVDLDEVLSQVDSIRLGTTQGTNALIERTGDSVGLITTKGQEDTVALGRGRQYGDGLSLEAQQNIPGGDRPDPIVPKERICGIEERMDHDGTPLIKPDEDDIRAAIDELIGKGVRTIAVVLLHSTENPAHEQLVERVFHEEYPSNVLGSTPVVLSSKVTGRKGEYVRTNSTVINAYLHRQMREGLKDVRDELRGQGYDKPLQLVHNNSGLANLGKTYAIQTIDAGPVAGLGAAKQLSAEIDEPKLITADMGGTSFDIGAVVDDGSDLYEYEPVIDRWLVNVPMVYIKTIGAGGGSVVSYDTTNDTLSIGPESMGSDPGPACYNRGGLKATVTDADVALGYINPEYFWGGKIDIRKELADNAIKRNVADDMGTSVPEAATAIRQVVNSRMAESTFNEISLKGYDPRNFSVLSYGGAGPTHACSFVDALDGVSNVIIPPLGPVLSAAGASTLDQSHIYERSKFIKLFDSDSSDYFTNYGEFNELVRELRSEGERDLLDESYSKADITHRVEARIRYGDQLQSTSTEVPSGELDSQRDLNRLLQNFYEKYDEKYGESAHMPESNIYLTSVSVQSAVEHEEISLTSPGSVSGLLSEPDVHEYRDCYFGGAFIETPVYRYKVIEHGELSGPAIVEHPRTTIVVNDGWKYQKLPTGASYLKEVKANE